jgi:hypothetical protein
LLSAPADANTRPPGENATANVPVLGTQMANFQSDSNSAAIPTNLTGIMEQNSRPEKGRWSGSETDAGRPLQWGRTRSRAYWFLNASEKSKRPSDDFLGHNRHSGLRSRSRNSTLMNRIPVSDPSR